jgi:hypothetical protein
MRISPCLCGATLFFHNTRCLQCERGVGFCPACRRMTALEPNDGGGFRCGHATCRVPLAQCANYAVEQVCNWCVPAESAATDPLCQSCRLTTVIPDLSVPGNRGRWAALEQAKRRMLYTLDLVDLDYDDAAGRLPLTFEFKGDEVGEHVWRPVAGGDGQVFTGHADGVITINIREADSVRREETRVEMGEPLRTLVGHFRHEVGHYFWDRLVKGTREPEFVALFGDHESPTYGEALERYYANGAPADWRTRFVTEYASMHPWEDFAETFAIYLDMLALLDTAGHHGLVEEVDPTADVLTIVTTYQRLGIAVNELNREMGLLDPAPFVLGDAVVKKLAFVHALVQ